MDHHQPWRGRRSLGGRTLRHGSQRFEPDGEKSHPAQPRPRGDDFSGAPATSETGHHLLLQGDVDGDRWAERWDGELCQPLHHSRPGSANQRSPTGRVTGTSRGPAWITSATSNSASVHCTPRGDTACSPISSGAAAASRAPSLVATFLGALEIVLDRALNDDRFASSFIVEVAVVCTLASVLMIPWEATRRNPTVDVRMVATRQFGACFLTMLATGAILLSPASPPA